MAGKQVQGFGEAHDCKPAGRGHQLAALGGVIAGLALCTAWALPVKAGVPSRVRRVAMHPCRLQDSTHLSVVEAQCGRVWVPENPSAPHGRRIGLFVARVPAVSLRKRRDPLFVLAGGPGQAAAAFYAEAAPAFSWIHRDRDIILVDQRGTGRSNGLYCSSTDPGGSQSIRSLVAAARTCLRSLSKHADVAFYTTTLAVGDLDRVRAALGYHRIDLYGVSYGTLVAEEYLRRFGQHVRTAILDGVVPPQVALGAQLPLHAQAALNNVFARCTRHPACRARFGDLENTYRTLRATLAKHSVAVSFASPTTGKPTKVLFTVAHLETVLRLSIYSSEQAALLPLLLHEAAARDDYEPLAAQYLIVSHSYARAIAEGMQNTVVCTEDVPFYGRAKLDRSRLERTFLGLRQIDALERVCAVWPHGPIDPRFHAPLRSSVPVLLLSGADDPVTPPAYAREVARGLPHHLLVVLRGMGHGQLTAPCVGHLMAEFVNSGSTRGLDVACTHRVHAYPFFTSFAGPTP